MSIYLRRTKKLTEDDAQNQPQQVNHETTSNTQASAAAQAVEKYNQDIIKCQNAINVAEQKYQEEKKRQNNNILQLQQKVTELGGTPIEPATKNESVRVSIRFSNCLKQSNLERQMS